MGTAARWSWRAVCLAVCVLIWTCLPASPARAVTLRVGIDDLKPSMFITPEGRPGGILGELLDEIAQREGWTLEPVACDLPVCLHLLRNGAIDLLPDIAYTPQRAEWMAFHRVPAVYSWSEIYARGGNRLRALEDLNGLKVAVLRDSSQAEYLEHLSDQRGVQVTLLPKDSMEQAFRDVAQGRADAVAAGHFIGTRAAAQYHLAATPIIFHRATVFFAAAKGQDPAILDTIDRYLRRWQTNPDSVYFRILTYWSNPQSLQIRPWYRHWLVLSLAVLLLVSLWVVWWLGRRERAQRQRLRASEYRLSTILSTVDAMIYIKDREGRYLYANNKLCQFFALPADDVLMRHDRELMGDTHTVHTIERSDQDALQWEKRVQRQERLVEAETGKEHIFLSVKVPLRNSAGRVEAVCAILTDATERLQAEAHAHRLSFYDDLTDLPNRRMLLSRLEQTLNSVRRGDTAGALLVLDLDHFKKINDTLGHVTGDRILQEVAQRLVSHTREHDTVSRVSGDEFMILFTQLGHNREEGARHALTAAEHLRRVLTERPLVIDEESSCALSASVGLTLLHADSGSVDDVTRQADLAMHHAKVHGGNCVIFYDQDVQAEVEQRLWMEQDLTQALDAGQLSLHAQPQVARDGRVAGVELLMRWRHPEKGAISPAMFIPLAEETGLIHHLTEWSLDVACRLLVQLAARGDDYPVSLNICPACLMDSGFVDKLRATLAQTGASARRLIFEITESVLIQDIEATTRRMNELSRMGVRFSIDDFGTGYSNLAYLRRLPVYELKVDRSLIQDVPDSPDSSAIARLILDMAGQMGLHVVAEGVETREQAEFFYRHGCDALQGYFFAKPMPLSQWLQWDPEHHTTPF